MGFTNDYIRLLMSQGDAKAQSLKDIAAINANAGVQQAQIWGRVPGQVADAAVGAYGQYAAQKKQAIDQEQQNRGLAVKEYQARIDAGRLAETTERDSQTAATAASGQANTAAIAKQTASMALFKDLAPGYAAAADKAGDSADDYRGLMPTLQVGLDHARQAGVPIPASERLVPPEQWTPEFGKSLKSIAAQLKTAFRPKPTDFTLAPGATRFDENGKPIANVPPAEKPDMQHRTGLNPQNKPDTYTLNPDGTPKWLGITPIPPASSATTAGADPKYTEYKPIPVNTNQWKVADDLAFGKMTFAQFRTLFAYSRDASMRSAIYDEAAHHNPNFNPAAFEQGYRFATNPGVQRQMASAANVIRAFPALIAASDAADRSGVTLLNKAIVPGGVSLGVKKYSNLMTASVAFADELSGALGFGSNTDMTREMGFDMTDPNLSPANLKAAITTIVIPFVNSKRAEMLGQMGIYGQPGMSAGADRTAAQGGTIPPLGFGGPTTPAPITQTAPTVRPPANPKVGDAWQSPRGTMKWNGTQWAPGV